jgi:hypothetical protein
MEAKDPSYLIHQFGDCFKSVTVHKHRLSQTVLRIARHAKMCVYNNAEQLIPKVKDVQISVHSRKEVNRVVKQIERKTRRAKAHAERFNE